MMLINNIKESHCSLELSKLLTEKGFDCDCNSYYNMVNHNGKYELDNRIWENTDQYFIAPTHSLVIKWVLINFGFDIWVEPNKINKDGSRVYYYNIKKYKKTLWSKLTQNFNSPEEATESALLHVLTNLI